MQPTYEEVACLFAEKLQKVDYARKQFTKLIVLKTIWCLMILSTVLLDALSLLVLHVPLFPRLSYYWIAYNIIYMCIAVVAYKYSSQKLLSIYINFVIPVSMLALSKYNIFKLTFEYINYITGCLLVDSEDFINYDIFDGLPWFLDALAYNLIQTLVYHYGKLFLNEINCSDFETQIFLTIGIYWDPDNYIREH